MTIETALAQVFVGINLDKTKTTPQISDNDFDTVQIRRMMNEAGREISTRAEWPDMFVTLTVNGSVSSETLPTDFDRLSERGSVRLNKTGFSPVKQIVAPDTWELVSARNSTTPYYHLVDGKVYFSPALDSDGAKVRYITRNWVSGDVAEVTQNSETVLFPEELLAQGTIIRWRRLKGLDFEDLLMEFEADLARRSTAKRGA
jgi:hypothetical protein